MGFIDDVNSSNDRVFANFKNPKLIIGMVILAIVVCIVIFFNIFQAYAKPPIEIETNAAAQEQRGDASSGADNADGESKREVCVHVAGCVKEPGIKFLSENARVADAIDLSGGFSEDADADAINLAREIVDGEQILVPSINATAQMPSALSQSDSSSNPAGQTIGKININTADMAELQNISGIGESKAKRIIDYREKNGLFKSIDELTNVSGIGEKTLENIKDQICI